MPGQNSSVIDEAMAVEDRSSSRLYKSVAIAKSGVYDYLANELKGFDGLGGIPEQHKSRNVFGVYRPAEVLDAGKDLFARQPVTFNHPPEFVNPDNFKKYAVGWTGDSTSLEAIRDGNDFVIKSNLTIMDATGIDAYDYGIREVSPGYKGLFEWKDGVTDSGQEYQIVMTKITDVNHVSIVRRGRGGAEAAILDSRSDAMTEEDKKGLLDGIGSMFQSLFKGKEIVDAAPEPELTLDTLPKDPNDFTEKHIKFMLGFVRDMALSAKAEDSTEGSLAKEGEAGAEKPEEKAIDTKEAGKEPEGEKASVEGEMQKDSAPEEGVSDASSIHTVSMATSAKPAFDLMAFDAQISGRKINKGGN